MSFGPDIFEWKKPDAIDRARGVVDNSNATEGALKESINQKSHIDQVDKDQKKAVTNIITTLRELQKGNSEAMERKLNEPGTLAILRENNVPVEYVRNLLRDMANIDHDELLNQIKEGKITKVPEAISGKVTWLNEGYQRLLVDLNKRLPEADIFDQQEISQLSAEVGEAEKQTADLLVNMNKIS